MSQLARSPRFCLAALMLAALVAAVVLGMTKVTERKDTPKYVAASQLPVDEMLSGILTLGYPLVLKAVDPLASGHGVIPWLQIGVHFLAVWVLDFSLRRFGASPWQAFAGALGYLLYAFNDNTISCVMTDSLGKSMAVIAVGMLLLVSARPRRIASWIGLLVATALCYHLRPAYLFMIGLVPILGFLLLRIRTGRDGDPFRWKRFSLATCGVAVLPFVGFCLLRLALVGHFGLVSFGGANIIGVAADMLDRKMIDTKLDESWRPLAHDIVQQHEDRGMESPFAGGDISIWQWHRNYPDNVWRISYPAAERIYGSDPVVVNRKLSDFSRAVIMAEPKRYVLFLAYNYRDGLGRLLGRGTVLPVVVGLALLAFAARVLICPGRIHSPAAGDSSTLDAMILVAALFCLAKLALVATVEVMVQRYVSAAGVLLPSVFALIAYGQIAQIVQARRASPVA